MRDVRLVGLDFGTTTSSCVVARARLSLNAVSGRRELAEIEEVYRSPLVFTPFIGDALDQAKLQAALDLWLTAGRVNGPGEEAVEVFGGGALLTGLAARAKNSGVMVEVIRSRLRDSLVASADDPNLEGWLAFAASAGKISRSHPDRWVVNLDIGGGTTNIALGRSGEVVRTGSLFVGARHVQVEPGGYRIARLSDFARQAFEHLKIARGPGDCLASAEVEALLGFYVRLIESALAGDREFFEQPVAKAHLQVPFEPPPDLRDPIITVSGGVGELVYAAQGGKPLPPTTFFGDLGIDLAQRLLDSPRWRSHFATFVPAHAGRATVYGLLLYTTQVSGSTLFLPDPGLLPLRDLPILGRVTQNSTDRQMRDILQLVRQSGPGGCVHVVPADRSGAAVATLGARMAGVLKEIGFPPERALVLLVEDNVGKALGNYVSEWGALPLRLVVLDEIEIRDARFVQIGNARNGVVPVSFYGMN
jgi:ethanolamine utilization protein EutA